MTLGKSRVRKMKFRANSRSCHAQLFWPWFARLQRHREKACPTWHSIRPPCRTISPQEDHWWPFHHAMHGAQKRAMPLHAIFKQSFPPLPIPPPPAYPSVSMCSCGAVSGYSTVQDSLEYTKKGVHWKPRSGQPAEDHLYVKSGHELQPVSQPCCIARYKAWWYILGIHSYRLNVSFH